MTDDADRLRALEERLSRLQAAHAPADPVEDHYSKAQLAWRMVIELVAGLMIGAGMGYGLDLLTGLGPAFLVIFTLLGFAAGVKTMIRSANEVQRKAEDGGDGSRGD